MSLDLLGWNESFSAHFQALVHPGAIPARVSLQHKHAYQLLTHSGNLEGICTGRLLHQSPSATELPVVGDWVAAHLRPGERTADIHTVLPRQTAFVRRAAGPRTEPQILAANIDTAFLVMALDGNFNLRRLERLLTMTWESGATPVVVLNKLDLCPDIPAARDTVATCARGADVITISALHHTGFDELHARIHPGRTVAVLGSSGVGKSTLVNRLLGEDRQRTGARRDDNSLGRHITVHRELLPLPSGALIIDTPGLREVGMWDADEGISETFADIVDLAGQCRFSDCTHRTEPGCAILEALKHGDLDPDRLRAWQKLAREREWLERRDNHLASVDVKRVFKRRTMDMRRRNRMWGDD